ncbi:hypothetical protein GCM10028833_41850 [Glycomyces tarimensis]
MPDWACEELGFREYLETSGVTPFVSNCVQSCNEAPFTAGATAATIIVQLGTKHPIGAAVTFGVGAVATCLDGNTDLELW